MTIDRGQGLTYRANYPIPGIDQSSQQFRDNFAVIRGAIENLQRVASASGSVLNLTTSVESNGSVLVTLSYPEAGLQAPAAVSAPVAGSIRYNTASKVLQVYDGVSWTSVGTGAGGGIVGAYVATINGTNGIVVTGSGDQGAAVSITSNATALNTASTIVSRDGSGNFAAGVITANLAGTASAATALANPPIIALGNHASGSVLFTGNANVTIPVTLSPSGVAPGTYTQVTVDGTGRVIAGSFTTGTGLTLSGDATGSGLGTIAVTLSNTGVAAGSYNLVTVDAKGRVVSGTNIPYLTGETDTLQTVTTRGATTSSAITITSNAPSTDFNTGALVVGGGVGIGGTLNVGGIFTVVGTTDIGGLLITRPATTSGASLSVPHGTSPTTPNNGDIWTTTSGLLIRINGATRTVAFTDSNITGSAARLTTSRNLSISGGDAVAGSTVAFDGTANAALSLTLSNTGVTAGTYNQVSVDAKGRVIGAQNVAYLTSESDTLATVTGRGASTGSAITISNSTASVSTGSGALVVTGGLGVGGSANIGGTLSVGGRLATVASATNAAGLSIPHGTAPTSPVDGDVWTTTAGMLVRISGSNKSVAFSDSNITGSAGSLATSRAFRVGGGDAVVGTAIGFNGTADVTLPVTLVDTGVSAGTYNTVVVDAKGRVISATNTPFATSETDTLALVTARGNSTTSSIIIANATAASSTTTGALTVTGGVGIGGGVHVGGSLEVGGRIITPASTTSFAGLTLPHGTAPNTPNNGDIWTTSAAVQVRINSTTRTIAFTDSNITGSAARLTTSRTFNISGGDATLGTSVSFDGTGNVTLPLTLANTGVAAGTYNTVVVDAKGRVVGASSTTFLTGNQTITLSGDATGSGSTAIPITLSNTGVVAGTYNRVVVDSKGRVTSASTVAYLTSENDTLATVTGRGATTNVASIGLTANTASNNPTTGALVVTGGVGVGGNVNVGGNLAVTGNLSVTGTTTTTSSNSITLTDALLYLSSNASSTLDTRDRGIAFNYGTGSSVNTGFFGWDQSANRFVFVPNATITNDVISGGVGVIEASLFGNASTATTLQTNRSFNIAGGDAATGATVSFNGGSNVSLSLTLNNTGVSPGTYNQVVVDAKGRVTAASALNYLTSETDTLATVTSRGSTTNISISLTNTTASTNTTTGALVVTGGVGVGGTVNIGGILNVGNAMNVTGLLTTISGMTVGGRLTTVASSSSAAGLRMPHGVAPSSPLDGDVWTTDSALQVRISGSNRTVAFVDGSITGSAGSLATPRALSISGGDAAAGGAVNFDGTGNVAIPLTLGNTGVVAGTYNTVAVDAKGRVVWAVNSPFLTSESDTLQAVTGRGATTNVATVSFTAATASSSTGTGALVVTGGVGVGGALNVGGGASFGGNLSTVASSAASASLRIPHGTAPTSPVNGDVWTTTSVLQLRMNGATRTVAFTDSNISGSAGSLANARSFGISGGDAAGGGTVAFDGTGNVTLPLTLSNTGVVAGTYNTVVVNAKGRVTSASNTAFLTSETDTLQSVTGRGASTTSALNISNATASASTGTGALVVAGGVGIGGALNIGGAGSFGGRLLTVASSTTAAGLNVPHGTAPTSPSDGDVWTTTTALQVRMSGTTRTVAFTNSNITGSAASLSTARAFAVGGGDAVTGTSVNFDGTGNVTLPITLASTGVTAGTYNTVVVDAKGRVTSASNTAFLTSEADTLATVTGRGGSTSVALSLTNATAATSSSTGALVVSGGLGVGGAIHTGGGLTVGGRINATASTTAAASLNLPHGTAPTTPSNGDIWTTTAAILARINGTTRTVAFTDSNITGSAASLTTARNLSISGGDAAAGTTVGFNGTANVALSLTLANSGVTAGTYAKVSVDAKGRVIAGLALTASDVTTAAGNAIVRRFTIPNTGGSAQWVRLGTFSASLNGDKCFITIVSSSGFNASINQNSVTEIYFKTSNSSSVNATGYSADSTYHRRGQSTTAVQGVKWVADGAGNTATTHTLFVNLGAQTGTTSFYTVATGSGTWTNNAATGQTDPGEDSATVLVSSETSTILSPTSFWSPATFSTLTVSNAQMTVNPPASTPPFVIGSNGHGRLVTGLRAASADALTTSITGFYFVENYYSTPTVTTDDRVAIQRAIDAANAAGGGTVRLGQRIYSISGATPLDVKANVTLEGPMNPGGQRQNGDYRNIPGTIFVNPSEGCTVRVLRNGSLRNVAVMNAICNAPGPTTLRAAINLRAAMSGIGIRIGNGSDSSGEDVTVENVMVCGFSTGIYADWCERLFLNNIRGDNLNGFFMTNCYDVPRITNVHFWPFLTANITNVSGYSVAISNMVNNGSGLVRVTTSTAHGFVTGDVVNIAHPNYGNNGGIPGIVNRWIITVIDSVTFDLNSSNFTGSYTGGLLAYPQVGRRWGKGFEVVNTDWPDFVNCFTYGYDIGFRFGDGCNYPKLTNCSIDDNIALWDPNTIGILIEGTAVRLKCAGGFISSVASAIMVNSTAGNLGDHAFTGMTISGNTGDHPSRTNVDVASGGCVITASDLPNVLYRLRSTGHGLGIIGCDMRSATAAVDHDAARTRLVGNRTS